MNYVVVKKGVFIQGVFGPLAVPVLAKALAQELATADVDSYHDWNVHSISIRGGLEGAPLASYRKDDRRPTSDYHATAFEEDRERTRAKKSPLRAC